MSETLIFVIIIVIIMFFMHRGHGAHGSSGMGCCGGHSHGSNKEQTKNNVENLNTEKEHDHQKYH